MQKYLIKHQDKIISTIGLFAFLFFSYFSIVEHVSLRSNMNDLGNFDQALYTTTEGEFMVNTNFAASQGTTLPSRFSKHSNYSLLLLVPIYSIISKPELLLLIQSLLVALGVLPLYWLGKRFFKNSLLPLLVPVIYLINPMIHDGLLYDFHPIVTISPIILFAFYALYVGKKKTFYVLAILIALTKEDAPLIVAMLGIYMLVTQKKKLEGAVVTVLSLVFFYLNLKYFMPFFSGTEVNPLIQNRFAHVGGSVDKGILTLVTKPWNLISIIVTPEKIGYLITVLLPFAFLPLLSPLVSLLAIPNLGINLVSSVVPMHYPFEYYYQVVIVTVFSLATLFSLKAISERKPSSVKPLSFSVLGLSLLCSFVLSPAPYSLTSSLSEFKVSSHARNIKDIQSLIPDNASLSIQNNLGPHFSHRMTLYTYPYFSHEADFVILDVTDPNPLVNNFRTTRTFMFNTQMHPQAYYDSIISLLTNPQYEVIYFKDGYLIFEKNGEKTYETSEVLNELNSRIQNLYSRYDLFVEVIEPQI